MPGLRTTPPVWNSPKWLCFLYGSCVSAGVWSRGDTVPIIAIFDRCRAGVLHAGVDHHRPHVDRLPCSEFGAISGLSIPPEFGRCNAYRIVGSIRDIRGEASTLERDR